MSKQIAIVGTGIAGLGAAEALLQAGYTVALFEQNDYVGGHTNTITVTEAEKTVSIDTGFMVFNPVNYPNLMRLFEQYQVPFNATDMSFSVQYPAENLEWAGASLDRLFAQKRNLLRPRFWRFLFQLKRFAAETPAAVEDPTWSHLTLKEYVLKRQYGDDFLNWFLLPMSEAIWSTAGDTMQAFPAHTLLRFFHNHNFLGMSGQHQWYTVTGGAKTYVDKLKQFFHASNRATFCLNQPVVSVRLIQETSPINQVELILQSGEQKIFDGVVLACHGDQALRLLDAPTALEETVLSCFTYQANTATLHTDERVMPKRKRAWAAWNYCIVSPSDGLDNQTAIHQTSRDATTHYWMNQLQGISKTVPYFVSINAEHLPKSRQIPDRHILKRIQYEHPVYTLSAMQAQDRLPQLNQQPDRPIYFAGSYFRYGFHEDAYTAGLEASKAITGQVRWP